MKQNMPSLATTQTTWMSIMTSTRNNDFEMSNALINEFVIRYGDPLPLIAVGSAISNSILDAYSKYLEEDPIDILKSLALDVLIKGENPRAS
jgi:hypothetical protein